MGKVNRQEMASEFHYNLHHCRCQKLQDACHTHCRSYENQQIHQTMAKMKWTTRGKVCLSVTLLPKRNYDGNLHHHHFPTFSLFSVQFGANFGTNWLLCRHPWMRKSCKRRIAESGNQLTCRFLVREQNALQLWVSTFF